MSNFPSVLRILKSMGKVLLCRVYNRITLNRSTYEAEGKTWKWLNQIIGFCIYIRVRIWDIWLGLASKSWSDVSEIPPDSVLRPLTKNCHVGYQITNSITNLLSKTLDPTSTLLPTNLSKTIRINTRMQNELGYAQLVYPNSYSTLKSVLNI